MDRDELEESLQIYVDAHRFSCTTSAIFFALALICRGTEMAYEGIGFLVLTITTLAIMGVSYVGRLIYTKKLEQIYEDK